MTSHAEINRGQTHTQERRVREKTSVNWGKAEVNLGSYHRISVYNSHQLMFNCTRSKDPEAEQCKRETAPDETTAKDNGVEDASQPQEKSSDHRKRIRIYIFNFLRIFKLEYRLILFRFIKTKTTSLFYNINWIKVKTLNLFHNTKCPQLFETIGSFS